MMRKTYPNISVKCHAPRCVGVLKGEIACMSPRDPERSRDWAKFIGLASLGKKTKINLCQSHFEKKYLSFLHGKPFRLLSGARAKPTIHCYGPDKEIPEEDCNSFDLSNEIPSPSPTDERVPNLPFEIENCVSGGKTGPLYMIEELPELYFNITLPYMEKETHSLQWVYDMIRGEAEQECVVYEFPCKDDKDGFVMIRDMDWDGEDRERLHLVALPYRPGILTIRDLRDTHLSLLRNIYYIGKEVIDEKYGIPGSQLKIYLHYLPSYYHLNIHFRLLNDETCSTDAGKTHLLHSVINNIEVCHTYYQVSALQLVLEESHKLLEKFREHGVVEVLGRLNSR